MTTEAFSLASGTFFQDWNDIGALTTNDDWSHVAHVVGYLGDTDATSALATGAALGAIDLIANQTSVAITNGGVAEFQIDDPVVALQGSGTADVPSLVVYLDATGRQSLHLSLDLRDVDSTADNTAQSFNIQYRVGDSGDWANLDGAYVADASVGPNAVQTQHLEFDLPSTLDGQANVQIRFLTANAPSSDEWLGVDNISVTSVAGGASDNVAPVLSGSTPADNGIGVSSDATIVLDFSEPVYAATGNVTITDGHGDTRVIAIDDASQVSISGGQVTIDPAADLGQGDTYRVTVDAGALRDAAGNPFAGNADNPVDFTTVNPLAVTAIGMIQGAGHVSAYAGATVLTEGVVTAIDTTGSRGFYLQDPNGDGDASTSDAIFVFTGATPTVHVGDSVQVSGVVREYNGGNTNNLTLTEITAPTVTELADSLGTVHATVIGEGGITPPTSIIDDDNFATFDPQQDGIDFYESLEGMLVTVHQAQAVAPTSSGATFVVADGGADATGINDRGGITVSEGDFNPERIEVYADSGVNAAFKPAYVQGDQIGDVSGVVSYYAGNYELLATSVGNTGSAGGLPDETTALKGDATHLTFAEYNVENLDPADTRFGDLGHDIAVNLGSPDVIALEEIQDADGPGAGDDLSGAATLQKLAAAIEAAGGPHYDFVEIAPTTANTTGGEGNGNIRNAFLYNPDRVSFVDGSARLITDTDPANGDAFHNSRMPLAADFTFNGQTVTTIAVHDYARSGSEQLFGSDQPPVNSGDQIRNDQTAALHSYVEQLQATNPDANIAVAGDFNAFYFEQSLQNLEAGGSLSNLTYLLDPTDRYSEQFEGNSEQIDHILVSGSLLDDAAFDIVHLNTGQANAPTDHDPTISRLEILPALLNGLATSAHVVAGGMTTGETLTGTDAADAFYFQTDGETAGRDTIALFGSNDAIVVDHKLYDSDSNGIVTFGADRLLDLSPNGETGEKVRVNGIDPDKGLRFLGERDGHYVYEDATVRPKGSQESTVADDVLLGTRKADVFFFDTALGIDLGHDTITQFGKGDSVVTTTELTADANGIVRLTGGELGLPGATNNAATGGAVTLTETSGSAVVQLHFDGLETINDVTYYHYGFTSAPLQG